MRLSDKRKSVKIIAHINSFCLDSPYIMMSFVRVLNTKVIDLWHLNSFLDNKLWNSAEMLENGVSLCIIY